MRKLNAIAEVHADNLLCYALGSGVDIRSVAIREESRFRSFLDRTRNTPSFILSEEFYNEMEYFLSNYRNGNSSYDFARDVLVFSREVIEKERAEMSKGYTAVYIEGSSQGVPGLIADSIGLKVIHLDDKNSDLYCNQSERESKWVEKISKERNIESSLLVAGAGHLSNNYGLVDKLRQVEIIPVVTLDLNYLCNKLQESYFRQFGITLNIE